MAGESAQSEYERRRYRRRERIRRSRGRITVGIALAFVGGFVLLSVLQRVMGAPIEVKGIPGPVLAGVLLALGAAGKLLGAPQSETSWRTGSTGEQIVGNALDRLAGAGLHVLHDRLIPGSKANIDHLAVGPAGVFTIDAKRYKGKLELRRHGSEIWVAGRNRSKLLDQARRQAAVATDILADRGFHQVPVTPVLCFIGTDLPMMGPRRAGEVAITDPRGLNRLITGAKATLDEGTVAKFATELDAALVPATGSAPPGRPGQTSGTGGATSPSRPASTPPPPKATTDRRRKRESRTTRPDRPAAGTPGASRAVYTPKCTCGNRMVMRVSSTDGSRFWGCETFPSCRHTMEFGPPSD